MDIKYSARARTHTHSSLQYFSHIQAASQQQPTFSHAVSLNPDKSQEYLTIGTELLAQHEYAFCKDVWF